MSTGCSDHNLHAAMTEYWLREVVSLEHRLSEKKAGENAHISTHVNTVIDEITRHYVSERTNRSLGSISSCLTTHCIIYIEVQSYFI